jgi:hypothetical protein
MVPISLSLLLLGTLSGSAWAGDAFNPNKQICIGRYDTWSPKSDGTCDKGLHGPMSEGEFLTTCFNNGTWVPSQKCGLQSEAPEKYKYKRRKAEYDHYTQLNSPKTESNAGAAPTDPQKNNESQGSASASPSPPASTTSGVYNPSQENIDAGHLSMTQRAQVKKDYEDKKKALEDKRKALSESKEKRREDRKVFNKAKNEQVSTDADALENADMANTKKDWDQTVKGKEDNLDASREQVRKDRKALKQARKDEREARRDNEEAEGVEDIKREHQGAYGGNYGGENVAMSTAIAQTSTQVSGATESVAGQKVQMAAQDREASLRQQGAANTNLEQVNEARRQTASDAKKALNAGGILDMALGAFQAFRAEEHFRSMSNVKDAASNANKELDADLDDNRKITTTTADNEIGAIKGEISQAQTDLGKCIQTDTSCMLLNNNKLTDAQNRLKLREEKKVADLKAVDDRYNYQVGTVSKNEGEENKSQAVAGVTQGVAAAGMMFQGIQKMQQAAAISAIEAQMGPGKQFGITLGSGVLQGEGSDGVNTLTPIQAAVTTEEEQKKEELAQNAPINPTDPNMIPGGPAAAPFEYQDPTASGAGAGGGPGMAGGTSADRSAMEAGSQGPAAVTKAGSYAAVAGGGGYKAKNAGGAGKAGVDTAFADLLKKFLPGAEPEKKKSAGELQFGDRSPASSQTAVIGRNKNIFEEISKRYQKKSAEGSVF